MSAPSAAHADLGYRAPVPGESLDIRVSRFLGEHPDSLRALVWLARAKVFADARRGRTPMVGAKGLIERLRWGDFPLDAPPYVHAAVAPNNSYASRIARIIAATHEDLAHVFVTRELASGECEAS